MVALKDSEVLVASKHEHPEFPVVALLLHFLFSALLIRPTTEARVACFNG